jgi:hypothetical protein
MVENNDRKHEVLYIADHYGTVITASCCLFGARPQRLHPVYIAVFGGPHYPRVRCVVAHLSSGTSTF